MGVLAGFFFLEADSQTKIHVQVVYEDVFPAIQVGHVVRRSGLGRQDQEPTTQAEFLQERPWPDPAREL